MSMQQVYTAAPGKKWRYSLNGTTGQLAEINPPESGLVRSESGPVRFAGSHEWKFWQHTPDRDEMATPLTDLAKGAIEQQKSFKPTAKLPAPYMQLPKHLMHSHGDLHDLAAVVAGTKPAAEVSYPQEKYHGEMAPHVRSLIAEAARRGHKIMITGSGPHKGKLLIGHPEHARQLAKDEVDFQSGRIKGDKDHEEFSRRRGRMLGYPDESIEDFLDAIRTGRDMWDQEGNRLSLAAPPQKQTRESAFGYLEMPQGAIEATFAQCAGCSQMVDDGRCLSFRPGDKVKPIGACNLYIYGTPVPAGEVEESCFGMSKPEDSGYVERAVRCGNCSSLDTDDKSRIHCDLYSHLNKQMPEYWQLREEVRPSSCCNAQTGGKRRLSLGLTRLSASDTPEPGVYLFRHGKTKLNTDGESPDLIRGWIDVPLDDKGKAQAEKLGPLGTKFDIKKVYSSDLERAKATADSIAEDAGLKVDATKSLRPWNLGEFQGKSAKDVAPKLKHYATETPGENVPDGESFEDYANRYLPFLQSVMDEHEKTGENIAIVTHYRNCKLTEAWVADGCGNGLDGDVFFTDDLPTGAVLRLYRQGDKWKCDRVAVPGMKMSLKIRFADTIGPSSSDTSSGRPEKRRRFEARPHPSGQGHSVFDTHTGEHISGPEEEHVAKAAAELTNTMFERREAAGKSYPESEQKEPAADPVRAEEDAGGDVLGKAKKAIEEIGAHGSGGVIGKHVQITPEHREALKGLHTAASKKFEEKAAANPAYMEFRRLENEHRKGGTTFNILGANRLKNGGPGAQVSQQGAGHGAEITVPDDVYKMIQQREALNGETGLGSHLGLSNEAIHGRSTRNITDPANSAMELLGEGKSNPVSEQKEPAADPAARPEFGKPGHRTTDPEKHADFLKSGGWKLHLAADPEHHAAIDQWLHENHKGQYKLGSGGEPGESDFTVYVGHKDEADALAKKIDEHFGHVLKPTTSGGTDTPLTESGKVSARFDPQTSPRNHGAVYYGRHGIPYDQSAKEQQMSAFYAKKQGQDPGVFHQQLARQVARIHNTLKNEYGDYYTGSDKGYDPVSLHSNPPPTQSGGDGEVGSAAKLPEPNPESSTPNLAAGEPKEEQKPAAKKYTNATEVERVAQTTPDALKPHVEEMMADKTPDEKKAIRDAVQAEVDGNPGEEERKVADQAKQELVEVSTGKKPRAPGSYTPSSEKGKVKGEVQKTLPGQAASTKQADEIGGKPPERPPEDILGNPPPLPPDNQPNLPFPEEPKPEPPQPAVKGETVTPEPHSVGSHQVGQYVTFENPHTKAPATGRIAEVGDNTATIHTDDGGSVTVPLTHPVQMETHERAPQPLSSFEPGHEVEFEHPGKKGQVVHGKVVGTHKDRGRAGKPGSEYVVVESNGQQLRIPKDTLAQHANPHEPATPPGAAGRDLRQEHLPGMGPAGPVASAPPKTPGQQKIQWPKEKIAGPPESMELPKQDRDKSIDALARNKNRTPEEDAQLNDLLGAPEGATYEGSGTPDPQGPSYHVVNYLGRRYFMDAERPGEMVAVEPEPNGQHKAYKHENGKMTPPVPVPPRVPKPPETGTTFDEPKEKAPVPKLESERLQRAQENAQSILKDSEAKADKKTKEEAGEARKKGEDFISKLAGGKGWPHALKVIGLILGSYIALRSLRRHPAGLGLMLGLAGLYFWSKHQAKGKEQGEAGSDEDAQKGAEDLMGHMTPDGDPKPKVKWEEPGKPSGQIPPDSANDRPIDRLEEVGPGEAESHPVEGVAQPRPVPAATPGARQAAKGEVPPMRAAPYESPTQNVPEAARAPKEGGISTPPIRENPTWDVRVDTEPEEEPQSGQKAVDEYRRILEERRKQPGANAPTPPPPTAAKPAEGPRGPVPPRGLLEDANYPGRQETNVPAYKVGAAPIDGLTPDIVNDELRALQTKGESGELPSDLQGRYGLVKFLAGVDLNDMPDTAAKRASDYIISQGGDAQVAQRLSDVVRDYVHRHGTNRMLKYRKENGGSQMSLGDPVRLPFLEGMSQSDRLRQLLHKKEWATFSPDEYEEYVHLLKQAGDQEDAGMKQENDEHRNRWNAYWDAYKSPGERPGEHPQQKRHRRYGELYREFRQRGHGTPQAHENAARALKDEDSPDVRMSLDNVFELAWMDFCEAGGDDTEENFQRLHRDVVRLSMGHQPDEVMTQIGDHIRSLSSAGR